MSKYPPEWTLVPIREIISESRIKPQLDDPSKRISVRLHCEGVEKRTERATDQAGATKYYKRLEGQFIYGKQNLHKGALGIVPSELHGYCSSQDIPAFDITPSVDPNWFLQLFSQRTFYESLEKIATGTGSKRIQPSLLGEKEIGIPPLPEQKKIAEIISELDKKISLSRKKVEKMDCLLKAIFKTSSIEKDCKSLVSLSDLGIWRGGGTPSKSIPEYWNGSIPWVSPKDMNTNRIYDTEDHITSKAVENSSTYLIRKGAIIFVVRSGILRNKLPIAVAERDLTINQDLKSLQINSQWDKDFIFYFLKSNSDKILSTCMKVGTTVESITSNLLMEFQIPFVSKSLQETLGKLARTIDKSIEAENHSIDSIIILKNALLQDLLSGSKRVSALL